MKILIAAQHRNIVGGAETYLQTLIPSLLKSGHQVAMLYDYIPSNPASTPVAPPEAELPVGDCEQLRHSPDKWREIANWSADVVYSQGVASLDVDKILQENYPTVLYMHSYWG